MNGNQHFKRGAGAWGTFDKDLSMVGLNDLVDDGEAEAGASGVSRAVFADSEEAFEEVGLVFVGNAGAVVGEGDFDIAAFAASDDTYECIAGRAVLESVADEVEANLFDASGVDFGIGCFGFKVDNDFGMAFGHFKFELFDDCIDEIEEVGAFESQEHATLFHAGDGEEVFDEEVEALGVFLHDL